MAFLFRRAGSTFGAVTGATLLTLLGQPAQAQPPSVAVTLGPAVVARTDELGKSELASEQLYLQQDVQRAMRRMQNPPAKVLLVIQDIQSNRPTARQLSLSAGLSSASIGLGGAAITGDVVQADGTSFPVRYRFFQDELRNETNFTTWGDANDAFDTVARDIGAGHPPDQKGAWPPPHAPRAPTGTRIVN